MRIELRSTFDCEELVEQLSLLEHEDLIYFLRKLDGSVGSWLFTEAARDLFIAEAAKQEE
jgi:hypothetical protein